ncbi:unnamed protein product [Cylindrotheca closterium]|uniref:Uncharacterized protein n=1 Tax=Cylindrotheca closterium TaxID=2856 RepID=A0AAD2FRY3_9STRA|nr:unnamed protein product [Cylindrotheca closterium]
MDLMNLSHTNKFHSVKLDGYWHRFDDSDILCSSAKRSHTLILGNVVISDLVLILQDDHTIQNLKTLEYFEDDVNRESFISNEGEGRLVMETLAESEILASLGFRTIMPPNMNLVHGNAEKEQSIWTDRGDDPEAKWVKNTTVRELYWSGTNNKRWDWEWPPSAVVGTLLDGFANLKRLTLKHCGLHKLDSLILFLAVEDCCWDMTKYEFLRSKRNYSSTRFSTRAIGI